MREAKYMTLKRLAPPLKLVFIYKTFLEQMCVVHLVLSTGNYVMVFSLWKNGQSNKGEKDKIKWEFDTGATKNICTR